MERGGTREEGERRHLGAPSQKAWSVIEKTKNKDMVVFFVIRLFANLFSSLTRVQLALKSSVFLFVPISLQIATDSKNDNQKKISPNVII